MWTELFFSSSLFCHFVDNGELEDQLVGSSSTVICCGRQRLELGDTESELVVGILTARLGFCVLVKETVGEKMVGGKGETIVL